MEQTPYLFVSCQYLPIHSKNISHLRQRLNAYQWDSVRCDQTGYFITFEESKKGEDEAARCFQECNLQFLSGKYVMNMECSQHIKGTVAEVAPAATHSDPLALLADHTSKHTPPKTRALSPHLLAIVTPPPENEVAEQLVADGIVLYQALINKRQSLGNKIERIEFAATETKKTLKERQEQMRHNIDVEMKRSIELRGLPKKGAYKNLKAEAINHDQKSKEQLGDARKRQKAVMQDLERQRNSLSREELLAFLERHTDNERAQKRRKVNSEGAHED
ncbi:histone methyltransferase set1 [Epicoccum nigrum]|nr:histone methyltransferase set1 [Epicoccum nigrum]